MRPLSDTLARLAAFRAGQIGGAPRHSAHLTDIEPFGSNPGALSGRYCLPGGSGDAVPLVVVLHGCGQTADGYDAATGWSRLGREYGFAVLYPEQKSANNGNLCFNWFNPDDVRRDGGEVLSIRQMIATMVAHHGIDARSVFVTGLSAGGAMALAMLATHPDVFAGGAIIAGLAYGSATTVPQAFDRMRGHGTPSLEALAARLKAASGHSGPWPVLSVWQGSRDTTVVPANADAIVGQWRDVHGVGLLPSREAQVAGHRKQVWSDGAGKDRIALYSIAGMGHGTPLDTANGDEAAAPFMLEAGISSTRHIAHDWGLIPSADPAAVADTPPPEKRSGNPLQDFIETIWRSTGLIK